MAARELSRSQWSALVDSTLAGLAIDLEGLGLSQALADQVRDVRREIVAELGTDPAKRAAEIEALTGLEPPEVIRYAEQLIRNRFSPISPLYRIWGAIADEMNSTSHLPGRGDWGSRPQDIRRFNAFQAMAWAVIDQFHGSVKP